MVKKYNGVSSFLKSLGLNSFSYVYLKPTSVFQYVEVKTDFRERKQRNRQFGDDDDSQAVSDSHAPVLHRRLKLENKCPKELEAPDTVIMVLLNTDSA